MTSAVRSIRCPVPYRRAPLMGPTGPGLDRVRQPPGNPSPPHADQHSPQLSRLRTLSRPTRPARGPRAWHTGTPRAATGAEAETAGRTSNRGEPVPPSAGIIRAANRTRACCAGAPLPAPHSGPRGDEVRHGARKADRSTPWTADKDCFPPGRSWSALPGCPPCRSPAPRTPIPPARDRGPPRPAHR
jgi:hypothetical protein